MARPRTKLWDRECVLARGAAVPLLSPCGRSMDFGVLQEAVEAYAAAASSCTNGEDLSGRSCAMRLLQRVLVSATAGREVPPHAARS